MGTEKRTQMKHLLHDEQGKWRSQLVKRPFESYLICKYSGHEISGKTKPVRNGFK